MLLVVDENCKQEVTQISTSLGGGCPVVHPVSGWLWMLSHKGLVSNLTVMFRTGLHHKTNIRSGIDAAEGIRMFNSDKR